MNELVLKIQNDIKELFDVEIEPEVTVAPETVEADFSSNVAMKLSGILHANPREIATKIAEKMPEFKAEVAGPGFLNFILLDEYFAGKIDGFVEDFAKNISCDEYSGKTVICEFSDPNPFKVLHVGHLYTSIVGDAISRLFEYAGAKVVRANFGGDVGLHVGKTLWALKKSGMKDFTIEDIAKKYVEGTAAYDEDEEAKAEIVKINKEIYTIAENDLHGSELADIYWRGRELSYQYFEDFYNRIGVKFDKYYPESTVAGRGLAEVKKGLAAGVYEISDGAVVYRGDTKLNLHTRVFINQEGLPTYEAKDVGLIFTKWDDYHFDKSVIITANDIIDYMKIVLASIGEMNPELPARTTHLTHGNVKLPGNVKMSSRKGNFLKAVDILNLITEELKNEYNSEDEKVVLGATKYAFLKYKMGGDIIFDPKESVKMTGNSGPYLLYSCVRAKKILSKIGDKKAELAGELNTFERALSKKIVQYKDVLNEAVTEMAPHKVCNFLYELAQEFSRFYENCPVAGDAREAERAQIIRAYLNVMEHGLNILGIQIPEEM
ncbi:MAG: arginine--tRNA ligase [Candidatus Saccharibacteria bacterium]|nr:arginine--tRNA ligase [Candidatus Saccharibacteria bacterium]